jgi:hypothetical protein
MPHDESPESHNESSGYNQIFEKLVVNYDEDSVERLIGMLAYAEYKLDKHDWMRSNPDASFEQVAAFLSHYNERVLKKYRIDAENFLYSYAGQYSEEVLNHQLNKLKDEGISQDLKGIEVRLNSAIKATEVSYMKPVWQGIMSSAIFTFILFIVALLIRFAAPNSGIGQLLQYFLAPDNYELRVIEKSKKTP